MGAGAFDRIKHPAVAGAVGCAGDVLSSCRIWWYWLCPPVGSGVPIGSGVPGRGLFAFYTLPCLVFLPIIWKNSNRAAAGVPGGVVFFPPVGAGVRFLLKKRTKKRKHGKV